MNTFVEFFLAQWVRLKEANFMRLVILSNPPLVFPQIAKNWISRKSKTTKVRFRTFPDLWRHPYTGLFCLILNLTYRTNETFFSRTLSFGSPFQTLVGGWLIKVLKMDKTMLRMKTLVWYPDGPRGVVSAHSVQSSNDNRCRVCVFLVVFFWFSTSILFLKFSVSWYHRVTEHYIIYRLHFF